MSNASKQIANVISDAIKGKTQAYDTTATVQRIEGDTAWVHIPGGVDETPVKMTIAAKIGDSVQVRVGGGSAWLVGNASAPPTDDTRANTAYIVASTAEEESKIAHNAAQSAVADANVAREAAESVQGIAVEAKTAATQAQNSLKSVVQGATTVEKAVSVMQTALEAVVDYDPQNDTVKEYFWHDANGAHVLGDTSGYRNDIDSTGMNVVEVSSEKSVAEFGADGARIGKDYEQGASDNESHMELDYHSFQMIDKDGNTYAYISDLRDSSGKTAWTEIRIGDGSNTNFMIHLNPTTDLNYSVNVSDGSGGNITKGSHSVIFEYPPSDGAIITISYYTRSDRAKAYTFGLRKNSSVIAPMSFAEGYLTESSGLYSHAEGGWTEATEYCSHAEGESTTASGLRSHSEGNHSTAYGSCSHAEGDHTNANNEGSHAEGGYTNASGWESHAEGYYTEAIGGASHAQNYYTKSKWNYQTAIGKYNNNQSGNAFEIGNGTADNARSNAFTVGWDGNVCMALNTTAASGTDHDLYAAITALNWQSEVIV